MKSEYYDNITPISYVAVSILFILSLGGLSHQKKARAGNIFGIIGMIIAIVATFLVECEDGSKLASKIKITYWIFAVPGAIIGIIVALNVVMTAMPQLVAGFHSFVGLAAVLVGLANFMREEWEVDITIGKYSNSQAMTDIETFVGIFIGAITFTGSVVAFGKLQGVVRSKPLILGGSFRHFLNLFCIILCLAGLVCYMVFYKNTEVRLILLCANTLVSFFIGWHLVMAIGGADMPVVVSMLNSYSGWATAASGFMLENDAMIVTGSLVGASGAILSYIMCEAMNRGFISVILGGFGGETTAPAPAAAGAKKEEDNEPKEVTPIDVKATVDMLLQANSIVIVPGFGLAVAHGQHAVASITELLRGMGKSVRFAIHPVAGRLPGHMNVLLAEASVPYDIVLSMDEINPDLPDTDVCIVVGANDIVNPIALTDPTCPIYGMPIIETFKSKVVIVNKRSMNSGYAGIDNPLFYYENTRMLFGDARKAFEELLAELQTRKAAMKVDTSKADAAKAGAAKVEKPLTQEDLPPVFCVLGVVKEVTPLERMVSISPSAALDLRKKGFGIIVESGAGDRSSMPDSEYEKVLCQVVPDVHEVYKTANVIIKVQDPVENYPGIDAPEISLLHSGQTLISFLHPARNPELVKELNNNKITALAMDLVPRITRAQKLDALSSLSNLAGYRSVVEAANAFGRVFTGQITAAGKLPPATVFVIGAGVAGLAAIGTAKGLGAIVKAFDTRKSVKEQIESMGGEFLPVEIDEDAEDASGYAKQISAAFIKAELELFARTCPVVDIIITTAAIPGKKAPVLITEEMVSSMKPGSVIVDLAAATGGNCACTETGKTVKYKGVTIIGDTDLIARMGPQASQLYSKNIINLLDMLVDKKAKTFNVNVEDEVIRQMCVCKDGVVLYPPPKLAVSAAKPNAPKKAAPVTVEAPKKTNGGYTTGNYILFVVLILLLIGMIFAVPNNFISHFMDFVLAIVVGFNIIWNVTAALHTPLMSVTNAVSGIICVGGMLCLNSVNKLATPSCLLGGFAVLFATINVVGGFTITQRMLLMFHD